MSPTTELSADANNLWRHWRVLCERIGVRLAGTDGEARAADYIAEQFERAGATVHLEHFPCTSFRGGRAELKVHDGRRWTAAPAHPIVGAPATPGGRAVEGEPVWLAMPEDLPRLARGSLAGKIALIFGPMPTDPAEHVRLMAAGPLAAVHVDERLPFAWVKNDGTYPYWVRRYGWPPFVAVSYLDAWRWKRDGIRRLRLRSAVHQVRARSQNVVADLKGSDPGEPIIVLGAHHDSQARNVGADDDAAGVVLLLEMARLLAGGPRRRTIRLISFGTEEQLSVGSAAYARAHRGRMGRIGLMLNFDGLSSPLGHTHVLTTTGPKLAGWVRRQLSAGGLSFRTSSGCSPFIDAFAFAAAGVPAVNFYRSNSGAGRWQHHSVHDNLDNVSAEPVCQIIRAVAPMVQRWATMSRPPARQALPAAMSGQIRRLAGDLFGWRVKR